MPARAYWKGQLRLALVSIPVEIYPATKSGASMSLRQIHEPTGKPIKYEKVVAGVGAVDKEEIVKGYERDKGEFVLLTDAEIEAVKIESRKTLELVQFVDVHDIPVLYYEKPYFVVPADELAHEAYIVLREALKAEKKAAIGQLSVRGRETLVALRACGNGIVLETLRYADEVQKAQSYFREIDEGEADEDLLALATTLIEKKSGDFEPEKFHDRYIDALKGLVEKKAAAKGATIIEDAGDSASPRGSNVIDLMAALKKSVGGDAPTAANDDEKPAKAAKSAAKPKATKKAKPADDEEAAPAPKKRKAG